MLTTLIYSISAQICSLEFEILGRTPPPVSFYLGTPHLRSPSPKALRDLVSKSLIFPPLPVLLHLVSGALPQGTQFSVAADYHPA